MPDPILDVLVVGAGQAGLAAGYHLKQAGLEFLIVEAAQRIGDSWRRRYDSLTLFTPRAFSQLPGLKLSGDPGGYPTRDEFADYLEAYAAAFALPVLTSACVSRLVSEGTGFRARLSDGTEVCASAVIVATGGFQVPVKPAIASGFDGSIVQLDPESYRGPDSVPAGRVLVVGDGASGRDIAVELAATRETLLAAGKHRKLFPERIMGRSVWWWLRSLGLMRVRAESFLGRIMRKADPFPDRGRSLAALAAAGVAMAPRLVKAEGRTATFADGSSAEVAAVVWAIGYSDDFGWLDVPGTKDGRGSPIHDGGISPVPGLYFLGRPWQRNRASALVMGVGDDAREIVRRIAKPDSG
ncbi:NAD(P)-binding domain-containing protein [Pseudaminobacter sp. 19-2017]|uniref:NAD(P)-binding domain-containing protein n=1 Tax=Pseudaminobacter soli (ex Zhang et al. 2022) TaxID=2831468 RepID=A0A942I4T0_9HYPH|nr:NAD(P)/FAD-dependent oxidoreductase [Pseudaminobacter soli]MBS3651964.1 NAD(P)-binding domain-containing protein [Pseudaminobacter soli]